LTGTALSDKSAAGNFHGGTGIIGYIDITAGEIAEYYRFAHIGIPD
jgi:hypothetical protein